MKMAKRRFFIKSIRKILAKVFDALFSKSAQGVGTESQGLKCQKAVGNWGKAPRSFSYKFHAMALWLCLQRNKTMIKLNAECWGVVPVYYIFF
jgi:hypothetical protein